MIPSENRGSKVR